jgi:hypothetical protein
VKVKYDVELADVPEIPVEHLRDVRDGEEDTAGSRRRRRQMR